ncbi:hypothetical protein PMAYCL1PPCAC_14209, partial [Pristionchus mayeri]
PSENHNSQTHKTYISILRITILRCFSYFFETSVGVCCAFRFTVYIFFLLLPLRRPSLVSFPRPRLFPLLQSSSMSNDYSAEGSLRQLRERLKKGISLVAINATWNTFDPQPKCSLCVGVQPLSDLSSFLEHVLSETHINKISSSDGKISAAQCYFWLDILQKGCTARSPV